ncbi:MAG: TIGR04086 family membrane protein [Clostridia bacterium]|nr:TIGR04086 family membrane protein [Clostridia bacterium]
MQNESTTGNVFFRIIKGVGLALAISFLFTVILASVLTVATLPDSVIYPVNQTVKVLAIAISALVFVRGEKGLLQGVAIGALFTALSYLAFSAIGGDFSLSWLILAELALAVLCGGVCGAIAVNLRRE